MAEKKHIIKVLFMKPKEAYFGLSEEKRKEFVAKATKDVTEVGGKWLTLCNCYWANEEWALVRSYGVSRYRSCSEA